MMSSKHIICIHCIDHRSMFIRIFNQWYFNTFCNWKIKFQNEVRFLFLYCWIGVAFKTFQPTHRRKLMAHYFISSMNFWLSKTCSLILRWQTNEINHMHRWKFHEYCAFVQKIFFRVNTFYQTIIQIEKKIQKPFFKLMNYLHSILILYSSWGESIAFRYPYWRKKVIFD